MADQNRDGTIHTVNLITQCLSIPIVTIFVALRFSIRAWYKQFILVEDTFTLLAWLLFMGYCGIAIVVGNYGGGYPISAVSHDNQVMFRKFCYIATAFYCPMALFTKIALLYILIRIFKPYKSKVIFIYVLLACLSVYYTISLGIKLGMCQPVQAYWTLQKPSFCLDQQAALVSDSVISMVTDLIILLLPLPLTWSLQMPSSKKLRVIGMLSAGGLATGFSVYRLVLVTSSTDSMTIMFVNLIMSGNAEGGVGLICACLPTLNILIRHLRKHGYSSNRYYNQQDSSMQLSKMKGAQSKGFSAIASKSDREPDYGSDQSHLITYAGAVDNGVSGDAGIYKTVDVSQKVEMVDERKNTNGPQGL